MNRRDHVKEQKQIFERMGINPSKETLDKINYSKDLFANHPRNIDGKKLSPRQHRGQEHGALTNLKRGREDGFVGWSSSVMHNMQDRRSSKQLTFAYERISTWYPGKFIDQTSRIPKLRNGTIYYY